MYSLLDVENETEVSFFSREAYDAFKLDPKVSLHLHNLVSPESTQNVLFIQINWE